MTRFLLSLLLTLAVIAAPALAQDSAEHDSIEASASHCAPWKLEAYRRRDVAAFFGIARSNFQHSILGHRTASVSASRRDSTAPGIWTRCPAGFRTGSLQLSIKLERPLESPVCISIYNRDNQLIARQQLAAIHAGRTDVDIELLDMQLDSNPTSIQLEFQQAIADSTLLSLELNGSCETLGEHRFATYSFAEDQFPASSSLILY